MSIGTQTQTESAYLSSSVTSLHRSKKSTSEISKTYKHASQLYLTRRLFECYEAIQPVIHPPATDGKRSGNISQSEDESAPRAPIALASTSQRIKIWSLYATLLNTVIELGDDEGKRDFGNKLYRDLVRSVQSGEVWEQIVRDGYMGREANVDAEVVYNLSNLLLAQAPDQTTNQTRLETYLSSSPHGNLDFSTAFENGNHKRTNGMDTPKDLNSRIKILELFTLHVLPRNNEWDYARSFVSNSDILDEERREAFLQTLNELQEVKEQEEAEAEANAAEDLVGFAEESDDETTQDEQILMNDDEDAVPDINDDHSMADPTATFNQPQSPPTRKSLHRRTSSEVDYGIDDDFGKSRNSQTHQQSPYPPGPPSQPRSTAATKATSTRTLSPTPPSHSTPTPTPSISAPPPSTTSSIIPTPSHQQHRKPSTNSTKKQNSTSKPSSHPSKSNNKSNPPSRLPKILRILANLTSSIAHSLTRNPTQIFRTLMFLVAMLAVLARKEVRERLRRMLGNGWGKVMETAGMGVKVSYV